MQEYENNEDNFSGESYNDSSRNWPPMTDCKRFRCVNTVLIRQNQPPECTLVVNPDASSILQDASEQTHPDRLNFKGEAFQFDRETINTFGVTVWLYKPCYTTEIGYTNTQDLTDHLLNGGEGTNNV